jgi:hypothetical protein
MDLIPCTEAEFLDKIQTNVLRVFNLAIHSHLYSIALRCLFLQTHATSYSFYSSVSMHCKGERRKTWKKTLPTFLQLKKSIQKHKIWELSRLCAETSTKLYVYEFSFWSTVYWCEGELWREKAINIINMLLQWAPLLTYRVLEWPVQ